MQKKGNGVGLTNEYLRQILELTGLQNQKLDGLQQEMASVKQEVASVKEEVASVKQEIAGIKRELGGHSMRMIAIEFSVRQIADFVGQDRARQDKKVEDIERRVEALERKAA